MKDAVQTLKSGMVVSIDRNVTLRFMAEKDITSAYVAWLNDDEVVQYTEQKFYHTTAGNPAYADKMAHFTDLMKARWDLEKFDADVRESQARRHIVYAALRQGHYYPWDYQPLQLASERFMRNHMDLNILEQTKRFPRGE